MKENEIIDKAIKELKSAAKPYMMFKDFSFLKDMEWGDDNFQKIRFLLIKSSPFEKHTEHAIKFSELGHEVANNHKDWFTYKKSLEAKTDYTKWLSVLVAIISLIWNIYQGITNNKLKDDNQILKDRIEILKKKTP